MIRRSGISCNLNREAEPSSGLQFRPIFAGAALILCASSIGALPALGQTQSASADSSHHEKICDGTVEPRGGSRRSAEEISPSQSVRDAMDTRSDADAASDRLRLSVRHDAEKDAEEARPLCKREKPAPPCAENSAVPCSTQKAPDWVSENELPPAPVPDGQSAVNTQVRAPETPSLVHFADGKLTIHASGEDFGSVLAAIMSATGLKVEMPPDAGSDPVFMSLGPAPVRDVVTALLSSSSRYNYVLIGSRGNPQQVARVIVSLRTDSGQTSPASATIASGTAQPALYGGQGMRPDPDDAAAENGSPGVQLQPSAMPSSVPTGVDIKQLAAQEGKSTNEILDELQKKQVEQLNSQASGQDANPPPQ
jgi:hypothetical protein